MTPQGPQPPNAHLREEAEPESPQHRHSATAVKPAGPAEGPEEAPGRLPRGGDIRAQSPTSRQRGRPGTSKEL